MIRIVLVDDQELVRTGLRALAEHDGDITVLAEAASGQAGLHAVIAHHPDVVLMDIRMPGMDGLTATERITGDDDLAGVRVLMLTTFDDDDEVSGAIRAGASGYLLKDVTAEELRHAIRVVAQGDALLSPTITRKVMQTLASTRVGTLDRSRLTDLTKRELEVLTEVGRGASNDEIAATLYISPATSRTYVSRLLTKLQARDRAQLVVLAYQTGLVVPGD
ncbi:MAG: response regulator transcription factor [Humibacillus sp.]|nr:response regulator transcription factor [Humibacillus sp.]MDN5777360.1 response regulator transcription factor [Humibacillus sp.]